MTARLPIVLRRRPPSRVANTAGMAPLMQLQEAYSTVTFLTMPRSACGIFDALSGTKQMKT